MENKDTILNKLEIAGSITVLALWLLRILVGPSMNFMVLLTSTLLSVYYLWFGFFLFNKIQPLWLIHAHVRKEITTFRIFGSVWMGVVMSYFLIAMIFAFNFYPGMNFVVGSAFLIMLTTTAFIGSIHVVRKHTPGFWARFYPRAIAALVFLAIMWFVPVEKRLHTLFGDYPDFIEAYMEHRSNPEDEAALQRLREERSRFR